MTTRGDPCLLPHLREAHLPATAVPPLRLLIQSGALPDLSAAPTIHHPCGGPFWGPVGEQHRFVGVRRGRRPPALEATFHQAVAKVGGNETQ